MPTYDPLKWQAEDAEDLVLVASVLQDAIVQVGDIKFDRRARTLTLLCNRFRWELPDYGKGQRIASALRIDGVLGVKARGISRANPEALAVILSIDFEPEGEPPGGELSITFAGGGEMRLQVEMIEAILADIGRGKNTSRRPDHEIAD